MRPLLVVVALAVNVGVCPARTSVCAMDFAVGDALSVDAARLLTQRLLSAFEETGRFDVMTTGARDAKLDRSLRLRPCTDARCAAEAGRQTGVDVMIVGSISHKGKSWAIECTAVGVAAGEPITTASIVIPGAEDDLIPAVAGIAHPLAAAIETPPETTTPTVTTAGAGIAFGPAWSPISGESDIERAIFDITNAERRNAGLGAVEWDDALCQAARQHSEEMGKLDYFAHESPVDRWHEPNNRIFGAGLTDFESGENIAYAEGFARSTLSSFFMEQWMNSPGHRANILKDGFTHLGVGVVQVGNAYYATQVFVNRSLSFEHIAVVANGNARSIEYTGRVLGRGRVGVWVNDTPGEVSVGADGGFSGTIALSPGLNRIMFGLRAGNSSQYDIRNAIGVDTRQSAAEMFTYPGD